MLVDPECVTRFSMGIKYLHAVTTNLGSMYPVVDSVTELMAPLKSSARIRCKMRKFKLFTSVKIWNTLAWVQFSNLL